MIPLKAVFVISVLISGLIFTPSYSFAQSNQNDNPLASFFEAFMKLFSFDDEPSEPVTEFQNAVVVQSSSSTPIANAGGNQTVMQFDKVFLDGSSSTDPDGDPISFQWNQTEGPLVDLSNATAVNPMFNATIHGILKFVLTVVDTSNLTDTDSVWISVNKTDVSDDDENSPPIANAGENKTVIEFKKVTLDGSSSTDPDGDTISFHWNQTEGPPVTLSSYTAVNPMFNAPEFDPLGNVLKFVLAVVDTSNETDTAEVYITVKEKPGKPDDGKPDNGKPDNGNGQDKVTLCHVPPGNPDNAHTITVGAPAKDAHLAHGDSIGECIEKSNSGKGNSNVDNSGKGSSDKDKNEKSNSGKGNSNVDNSGKGSSDKDKNEKSNSGKGNNLKNEAKIEDEDDDD